MKVVHNPVQLRQTVGEHEFQAGPIGGEPVNVSRVLEKTDSPNVALLFPVEKRADGYEHVLDRSKAHAVYVAPEIYARLTFVPDLVDIAGGHLAKHAIESAMVLVGNVRQLPTEDDIKYRPR